MAFCRIGTMSATLQAKIITYISISDIKNEKQGIMSLKPIWPELHVRLVCTDSRGCLSSFVWAKEGFLTLLKQ